MNRMQFASIPAGIFIAALALGAGAFAGETLTIAGDPCTIPLAKKLGEEFTKKTGVTVTMDPGGCRSGVSKVIDGKADIGVSTFNFAQGQLHPGVSETVIGKAPIVMIVNKSNPVEDITREQLRKVLTGQIRNWKELGGVDTPIKNVMLPPCVVETMTHQAEAYGGSQNLSKLAKEGNPMTNTNALVAENEGAIGMQLYGHDDGNVKALKIEGVLPSAGTVPGAYGYFENYNIIAKKNPSASAAKFIEFAKSREGREIMLSMKHIPESGNN